MDNISLIQISVICPTLLTNLDVYLTMREMRNIVCSWAALYLQLGWKDTKRKTDVASRLTLETKIINQWKKNLKSLFGVKESSYRTQLGVAISQRLLTLQPKILIFFQYLSRFDLWAPYIYGYAELVIVNSTSFLYII